MVGVLGERFFYIGGRKDWKECAWEVSVGI